MAQIVQIPRFHRPDISHRRIFADIEVIDVLNGAGQGIRFLRQQPRPLALEVDIIFVFLESVALCQVLLQDRDDFIGLGLKEMEGFDEALDKGIHRFFVLFDVIRRRQKSRIVNHRPIG